MNSAIPVMRTLQHLWQRIENSREEIQKHQDSIAFWRKTLEDLVSEEKDVAESLKDTSLQTRQLERELQEQDQRKKHLEDQKLSLADMKQIEATNREIASLDEARDNVETAILSLYEKQETLEARHHALLNNIDEKEVQVEKDIIDLNDKIAQQESFIAEEKKRYDDALSELDTPVQKRFEKVLIQRKGKAVVSLVKDVCQGCHFTLPSDTQQLIKAGTALVNCPQCGRYIFWEN